MLLFLFKFFVFLYTICFLLIDGKKLLEKILYSIPLEEKDERRMLDKFISVTQGNLKGTAVIGVIQGAMAGLAVVCVALLTVSFQSIKAAAASPSESLPNE